MKINLLICTLLTILTVPLQAQVTIGSGIEPNPDALLDLKGGVSEDADASDKGLLLPRVALQSTTLPYPMQEHVAGMFVYNTETVNDVVPGIYYNDGTKWQTVPDIPTEPWNIIGGTTAATSNTQNIYQTGKVAIGANYGTGGSINNNSTLEVNGTATNKTSFNAGTGVAIDFTRSNLACSTSTDAAPAFSCTGLKDGGTYTLAWQGDGEGIATVTTNMTTTKIVYNKAKLATQDAVYTIVCINTTAYVYVTIF